jgi:release factor glutamine methyltransferase
MSLRRDQAIKWGQELLQPIVGEAAFAESRLLFCHSHGLKREDLISSLEKVVCIEEMAKFSGLIKRRVNYEPIAKIIGQKEFWSLPFHVTKDTLDPRPDSETLIEAALGTVVDKDAKLTILDLGTGSGCLLLSLLSELPNALGVGIDKSFAAISVANKNAQDLELEKRAGFCVADWVEGLRGKFDIVISNPPYLSETDMSQLDRFVQHDPLNALFGGHDGLNCYRILAPALKRVLKKNGLGIFEIGSTQENTVSQIIQAAGLRVWGKRADLNGITRCLMVNHVVE